MRLLDYRRLARRGALAALAALCLAAACDVAARTTSPAAGGATFTGRWAGQPWAGTAAALRVVGAPAADTLYVTGAAPPNSGFMPRQSFRLRVAPFVGVGDYPLAPDAVAFEELVGGDVVTDVYRGRAPQAGVLRITAYEPATGAIAGTVEAETESARGAGPYGARARFEDGHFTAVVRTFTPPAAR